MNLNKLLLFILLTFSVHGLRLQFDPEAPELTDRLSRCIDDAENCNPDAELAQDDPRHDVHTSPERQDANRIPHALKGGLAYIKVLKVGSSTWAGVMRRIGKRNGLNHVHDGPYWMTTSLTKNEKPSASLWANHGKRRTVADMLSKLMPHPYFVTLIRDPVDRALSSFYYFEVQHKNVTNSDENKINYLSKPSLARWQMNYIKKSDSETPHEIMQAYDFIGVTERFDESLLILGKKLGLKMSDLLYVKSKVSQNHPPFEQESKRVQTAARQNLEQTFMEDKRLHKLANDGLDQEISTYPTFEKDLKEFRTALEELQKSCGKEGHNACLWQDNGCAQDCIDAYALKSGL